MNHRRTLESLFRLSLGIGCDPGAQHFLFFTRFPAPRGQQRERHRLTSPGYFVFLWPTTTHPCTNGQHKGAVGQGVDSFHGPPQRVVEQAPASRCQGSVAQWQPGDNCISSRATPPSPKTRQRPLFPALAPPSNVEGGARQNQAARGVLRDAGAEIFHMQVRLSPVTSIHVGAHHCRRLLLGCCGHSAGHGDDGRLTIRSFTCASSTLLERVEWTQR